MKLTKKLVIMTGKGYEKGTVCLEKNELTLSARVNLHNLRNLFSEKYFLFLICTSSVHTVELGSNGTLSKQFLLPFDTDISTLHCAVFVGDAIALYGTSEKNRMWEGNLIDLARRHSIESKKIDNQEPKTPLAESNEAFEDAPILKTDAEYSSKEGRKQLPIEEEKPSPKPNKRDINDFFLEIINNYNDEAVAEVNYYNLQDSSHSSIKKPFKMEKEGASFADLEQTNASEINIKPKNNREMEGATQLREERVEPLNKEGRQQSSLKGSQAAKILQNADTLPTDEAAATSDAKNAPPLEGSFSRIRLGTFYEQIKEQIEEIFKTHSRYEELEKIIPDSKWALVDYNSEGKFYVVGIIGKPDYICYGIPATYTEEPPPELDGYCQWLPLDLQSPTKRGFWLLFQDAVSGESIKNEII